MSLDRSIFILGASRLQIPAIQKAKEKGFFVYVLDYDPEAVGIKYADRFLEISTTDREAVYEAAQKYRPDHVITSTSDMPVRTVSWVCEKLGMKTDISYEGSLIATDKVSMRLQMKKFGVPIPDFHIIRCFDDLIKSAEMMPSRFILKPADNAASRGVILIDKDQKPDYAKFYEYCLQYSRGGEALVEEYLEGPEVSVESYSVDGVPHIITITDKIVTELPFFVELGHTEPSRLPVSVQDDIRNVATAAINAIGMQNGPTHTEIKITPSGARLIEIAARLGGDFITSRLVPLSTGVDMIDCSFSSLLGEDVNYVKKYDRGAAIRFIQGSSGILKSVEGTDEASMMPGVTEVEIYAKSGDHIRKAENSSDRIGHVIATGQTADEAEKNAENALSAIRLIYA